MEDVIRVSDTMDNTKAIFNITESKASKYGLSKICRLIDLDSFSTITIHKCMEF